MTIKGFESRSLLFIMSKNHVECNMQIFKIRIFTRAIQAGKDLRTVSAKDYRENILKEQLTMLSYIRRAQRRRMYQRANSDSGCSPNEPESPSSPVNSSAANGQNSEGFHFYATVKKQNSLPEVGTKSLLQKTRATEKRVEKINDADSVDLTKKATGDETTFDHP